MEMSKSRVLETMRAGKVAKSIKLNLCDPRIVEIAGMCGFDAVWLDMEHVPTDWRTIDRELEQEKFMIWIPLFGWRRAPILIIYARSKQMLPV